MGCSLESAILALALPPHTFHQRLFQVAWGADAGQSSQRADGGRQRPHEGLARTALAQMGLEYRPFFVFEVVLNVGGRVIGYVFAVELALPEESFYRSNHNTCPGPILIR